MKRNEEKNVWNFFQATVVIGVSLALLIPGSCPFIQASVNAAGTGSYVVYTIENPEVDFEVIDAEPFDGYGDNGPYATFNDVLLGTIGECRSMVEFDITNFSVPPGEIISAATLEMVITDINLSGLGVNGETPESVVVDGYIGNGLAELSDFQAGDGNVLDTVDTPDPQVGQTLSFDVTTFVTELVNAGQHFVGLAVRAGTFGGLWVTEGSVYPKLTIETMPAPQPDLHCDGSLSWSSVTAGSTVEGSFEVSNIGDNGSMLTWQIDSTPSWGTWSFVPSNGTDLPKGTIQVVNVTVVAPSEKHAEFNGTVRVVNLENPDDYEDIPVYLKTPLTLKNPSFQLFLERLFQRFPRAFPILRQLVGY
jgi:hypothetical protein